MKKILYKTLPFFLIGGIYLNACTTNKPNLDTNTGDNEQLKDIYENAVENGFNGTYEEWIQFITNGNFNNLDKHKIHFNTDGGTLINDQFVIHGEKILEPVEPMKEGFVFKNWTYNGVPWSFIGYVVTEDMTLVANYETKECKLNIDYDNGNPNETFTYQYNETVNLDNPKKDGFRFLDWINTETNIKCTFPFKIVDDISVKATYSDHIFIYFDTNGGDELNPIQYKIGEVIHNLPTPVHDSLTFDSWYLVSDVGETKIELPLLNDFNNNITLKARYKSETLEYKYDVLNDGTARLTKYIGNDINVVIPNTVSKYKVSSISNKCFKNNNSIVSVKIGDDIKVLEDHCFDSCTNLENVDFGRNISNFGEFPIYDCPKLKKVSLLPTTTLYDLIKYSNSIGPSCIEVYIKYDYENIGDVVSSNIINKVYNGMVEADLEFENGYKTIPASCFQYGIARKVILPDSINELGDRCFRSAPRLQSINIPPLVKVIPYMAFLSCDRLTDVRMSDNVEIIEQEAFNSSNHLANIHLSNSLISLGYQCFSVTDLRSIIIPPKITYIPQQAFSSASLQRIYLPKGIKVIAQSAFSGFRGTVYFEGTQDEWKNIEIENYNTNLLNSNFIYNAKISDTPQN